MFHFVAGAITRKARNLSHTSQSDISITGDDTYLVVDGKAMKVSGEAEHQCVATVYASKYVWNVTARDGSFYAVGAPCKVRLLTHLRSNAQDCLGLGVDETFNSTHRRF